MPGNRTLFLVIFVVAFLIRAGAVLSLRNIHEFHGPGPTGADGVEFNQLALNMASGHGYVLNAGRPTSFRAPGFPFLLAAIYLISWQNYVMVYLVLCLAGALACSATYLLALELLTRTQAITAAGLMVVYFPHIYFSTVFLSEALFTLCLAFGALLFVQYLKTGRAAKLALAGLIFGYATLTRPFALLFLPMLAVVLLWTLSGGIGVRLRRLALFTTAFLAVILPWAARNYVVHHKFVLLVTNSGSGLYSGNNDRVLNERPLWGYWITTVDLPYRDLIDATPDEVSHERVEYRLGWEWIEAHWKSMPKLWALKLARFWAPDLASANKTYTLLSFAGYVPFLLLYLWATVRFLPDRRYWTPVWLVPHGIVLVSVLAALIFYGHPRYRDGNTPVLMLYAALPAEYAIRRLFLHRGVVSHQLS